MKRAELDRRIANGETLDDIVPALMDDGADITSYDDLKRFAIEKIESDELYLAEHVLKACLDVADYYGYGVWTHNGSDFLWQTRAGFAAWGG